MGQRSQIYVRYDNENKKGLVANYYQWNYGERMISRARWGIESIKDKLKYNWYYQQESNITKLSRMFDTNFDMKDIQMSRNIITEHREEFPDDNFNEFVFKMQGNNDGKLFVDIDNDNDIIKYAFLDYDTNIDNIMDGEGYMNWNNENWLESKHLTKEEIFICQENIKFISENAKLMTKEEIEEFMNYDYGIE